MNRGEKVNHKHVQRIMHSMELMGKRPKEKYHSYKGDVGKVADNVINEISAQRHLFRNGQQMFLSLIFPGVNAIFHQFLICTQMKLFPTIYR